MLIIAVPKSASTSLMTTMKRLHNIESKQILFPNNPFPTNCKYLYNFHSDVRELDEEQVTLFRSKKILYKQHIFPSPNNLKRLKTLKKVILLRTPQDVVKAYYRAEKQYVHNIRNDFQNLRTPEEWIEQAKKLGLLSDLKQYYMWRGQDNVKIVYYRDLISSPKKVINKIESFYDLPITRKNISLDEKRYSRINSFDKLKNFINNRVIKSIMHKIR